MGPDSEGWEGIGCSDLGEPSSVGLRPPGFLPCWAPKGFKLRLENVMRVCVPGVSEALICFFSRVYHVPHRHAGVGLRGCGPCVCGSEMSVHL